VPETYYWTPIAEIDEHIVEFMFDADTEYGKVIRFALQLAVRHRDAEPGDRQIIRRYDCAHDHPHLDVYDQAGNQVDKRWLDNQVDKRWLDTSDLNEALNQA
jgi:hypothetical protein